VSTFREWEGFAWIEGVVDDETKRIAPTMLLSFVMDVLLVLMLLLLFRLSLRWVEISETMAIVTREAVPNSALIIKGRVVAIIVGKQYRRKKGENKRKLKNRKYIRDLI
tara:strand:+ start:231 stop:557 length:327 start_codon:yes stop_codon:yes gene_type:complete